MQVNADNPATTTWSDDDFELGPPSSMRPGMYDPEARLDDMDLEGIDAAIMFPPGTGEELALHDRDFAIALCRTLNDARAEFGSYAPDRIKLVAKLPMIDPAGGGRGARTLRHRARLRRHGVPAAHPRQEPRRPEVRRRVGDRRAARRRGQRPRRRPGAGPGAVRHRSPQRHPHRPRVHAPGRRDARGHELHRRRHPASLPALRVGFMEAGHRLAAVLARAARRALGAHARPGARDRPRAVALLPRRQLLRHVRARRDDGSLRAAQR